MNEEHHNKAIMIIIGILLFLCIVSLIITSIQYSDSGDKGKDIGYTKLFGNNLRGYTCVSDEKSIKVELECGLLNKCRVYPIQ